MNDDLKLEFNHKGKTRNGLNQKHDPRIVELVKLLARISAERDYTLLIKHKNESLTEEPRHE
jgi:hypothetical protein